MFGHTAWYLYSHLKLWHILKYSLNLYRVNDNSRTVCLAVDNLWLNGTFLSFWSHYKLWHLLLFDNNYKEYYLAIVFCHNLYWTESLANLLEVMITSSTNCIHLYTPVTPHWRVNYEYFQPKRYLLISEGKYHLGYTDMLLSWPYMHYY